MAISNSGSIRKASSSLSLAPSAVASFLDALGDAALVQAISAAIHAAVAGTRTYMTEVCLKDDGVDGDCNCAHAADGWLCKHQVAVALIGWDGV